MTWSVYVKNFLKRDDLIFEEFNFGIKPDANGNVVDRGFNLIALEKKKVKPEVKATSILTATVKPKFMLTVDKFADDPAKCWEHFQQRFGGDILQRQRTSPGAEASGCLFVRRRVY